MRSAGPIETTRTQVWISFSEESRRASSPRRRVFGRSPGQAATAVCALESIRQFDSVRFVVQGIELFECVGDGFVDGFQGGGLGEVFELGAGRAERDVSGSVEVGILTSGCV